MPQCEPPPTVAATIDPSKLGSRTIFAGDPRYNDPDHHVPVMSRELSALVEKIRSESKSEPRSKAFITAEEVRFVLLPVVFWLGLIMVTMNVECERK